MPNLSFTAADVARAAGRDPWQRQREFSATVRPEDMQNAARAYRVAADEAANTGELAEASDRLSGAAGASDGAPIADAQGRIDVTRMALGDNGQRMRDVVTVLVESMNFAMDEEAAVRELVTGPGGLDAEVERYNQEAVRAWADLEAALDAEERRLLAERGSRLLMPLVVDVFYGDRKFTALPTGLMEYALPDDLAQYVRERHLGWAAESATRADDAMTDEIDQYRATLERWGARLTEMGYDLNGKLGLWTSAEAGALDARMLREELAKDQPDPGTVDMYARRVEGIVGAVQGIGGEPGRPLDGDELAYLERFYGGLDGNALAALGRGEGTARTNVANGINTLTDPAVGGVDPSRAPQSIRDFLYGYQDSGVFTSWTRDGYNESLGRFNDFGRLMGAATVAPGEELARQSARAAIDVQEQTAARRQGWPGGEPGIANTGSSDLLRNVALNEAASAGILNDPALRDDLLAQRWDDDAGVSGVVTGGTTIPPELVGTAGGQPYANAALNVLTYAARNHEDILGTPGLFGDTSDIADHGRLERAVGETATRYLDFISQDGVVSALQTGGPSGSAAALGQDLPYGFTLSAEDRRGLFQLMAVSGEETSNDFYTSVGQWKAQTLGEAFAAPVGEQGSYIGAAARISGTEAYVHAEHKEEAARIQAAAIVGAKIGAGFLGPFAGGAAELGSAVLDPNASLEDEKEQARLHGSRNDRILMADQAVMAGLPDVERAAANRHELDPARQEDWPGLTDYVANMQSIPAYGALQGIFDEHYQRGLGAPPGEEYVPPRAPGGN